MQGYAFEMDLQDMEAKEICSDGVFADACDLCKGLWENPCLLVEYIYNKIEKQNGIIYFKGPFYRD